MKKNTQLRIISALILASLVVGAMILGKLPTVVLLFFFGVISLDEIETNFLGNSRNSSSYFLSQFIFIILYSYFGFLKLGEGTELFIYICAIQNLFFMYYLFAYPMESKRFINRVRRKKTLTGVFILLPFLSTLNFLTFESWYLGFGLLALVNFGMDTFAWFFGKNFGKRKLWPSVSPNKTVEGLIGGVVSSGIVGFLFFHFFMGGGTFWVFPVFLALAFLSQIGDLFQSKVKRQIGIKDSSSLIPGHGGVYDRIDSIVFMAPFMAIFLNLFYL